MNDQTNIQFYYSSMSNEELAIRIEEYIEFTQTGILKDGTLKSDIKLFITQPISMIFIIYVSNVMLFESAKRWLLNYKMC